MTPTRPFDPDSVLDQLLAGRAPAWPEPGNGPALTSEESAFVTTIRTWCDRRDPAWSLESSEQVPADVLDELRTLGAFRITIPTRYGGLGYSDTCLLAVLAVLTTAHATLCEIVAAHQVIGAVRPLMAFGTDTQQSRYLPALLDQPSAFALNEPDLGYGLGPLTTTAHYDPDEDCYRVSGTKTWITNATIASHAVILVDLVPTQGSSGGITALLVSADDAGVSRGPRSSFAGLRGLPNGRLRFTNARIPADRLIGTEGGGLDVALTCLAQCRAALPVTCLTTTTACLIDAAAWAREDRQTRRGLHHNPQTQRHLARLMTLALIANAVTRYTIDPDCAATDAETAKLILSETATEATDTLVQLIGGRGYETAESARRRHETGWQAERLWRDTRVTRIFDSSTEMLKDLMAQPFDPPPGPASGAPSSTPLAALADPAAQLHQYLSKHGEDPAVRAAAVDVALDLFTLYCLCRYQHELGEDHHPTTTAWDVLAGELHQRVEAGLDTMHTPDRLALTARLSAELTATEDAQRLAPPFTRTLTDLGVPG